MAGTLKFEIVSPEKVLLSGDAEQVMLPGSEGDMTVLPGHAPVISTLRPGMIEADLGESKARIYVKSAFVEVTPARVTVLADNAYSFEDLNAEIVSRELAEAERAHAEAVDDHEKFMTSEAINALTKLKTAHW
jgi:F-type H+-transporting ATPase subunit epsilon